MKFTVQQSLQLFVNHDARSVNGISEFTLQITDPALTFVELNARQIVVDKITLNSSECFFEYNDPTKLPIVEMLKQQTQQFSHSYPDVSPINFRKILLADIQKSDSDRMRPELKVLFPNNLTLNNEEICYMKIHYHFSNPSIGAVFNRFSNDSLQFFTYNQNCMARYWMPCFDTVSVRCKWKISIYTPKFQLTTVTVGEQCKNVRDPNSNMYLTEFIQQASSSACDIVIYCGDCKWHNIANTNIHLFFPKTKSSTISLLEDAVIKVTEFTKWFMNCSFPFDNLNVVVLREAVVPFAVHSNCIFLSSTLLYDAKSVEQPFITRSIVSLAICSVYFGSFVFHKTPNDSWLILGLAYYLSRHFCKFLFGTNDYKHQLKIDIESVAASDKGKTALYNGDILDNYSLDFVYKKSSLVLHLIEQKIDKIPLQKVLNSILNEFGNGELSSGLSTHHFFKIIRKMTGKDLKATGDQWIFNSGCPIYNCTFTWNRTKNVLELNMKQQSELVNSNFYGQLTVRVFESEGVYDHVLQVDENSQYFELPVFTRSKKKTKKKKTAEEFSQEPQNQPQHLDDEQDEMEITDETVVDDLAAISTPVEWVVVDPELNWIAMFNLNNTDFLWSECLEEEKDVIAQHQAIRTLQSFPSEISAMAFESVLTNWKTFYKLRIEACLGLAACSTASLSFLGFGKLVDFFCKKFCFPSSSKIPPGIYPLKPNDFELIQNGFIQKMLCFSIGACNQENNAQIQNQILCILISCLLLNDNAENPFSDTDYIAGIFFVLSVVINKPDDPTVTNHLKGILDEIQRYLFLDKIQCSFQNALTVSVLSLLKKLQILSYVPIDLDFYTQLIAPSNFIDVRLAAVEAICMSALTNDNVFRFVLSLIEFDNNYSFRLYASKCLLEAFKLHCAETGKYENNSELKNIMLGLLVKPIHSSLKKILVEIAAIIFTPFSLPELEEEEEEGEDEEEVEGEMAEPEQSELEKGPQLSLKLKIGKKKKSELFVYPLEAPEHLLLRVSRYILDKLNNYPDAYIFKYPVDPETPFYYDIIEHPIDLSKISAKHYASVFDFFADLALLLRNCFSFNDHNSSVATCAKKVKNLLLREVRKIIPAIEQGTILGILRKETEISPDIPLIRYSLLQLRSMESSQPFLNEFVEIKAKIDDNQLRSFDEFRQEVVNIVNNSAQSDETITAFSNAFNDFLTAIGKKKATVPCKSRRRIETIVDNVVSKLKYPSATEQDQHGLLKHTLDVLAKLYSSEASIWFRFPVDPVLHNAPDYFEVIGHPIDLSTITQKLQSNQYESAHSFEEDMILLFENCYQYNPEGSRVCEDAKNLEKLFVKEWGKVKEKVKKQILGSGSRILIDLESDHLFPTGGKKYQSKLSEDAFDCAVRFIFYRLSTQSFSQPFLYPVSHNVISYYNIIKQPMALCTMQEKYFAGQYGNVREVENDLELMLKNCYFFNQSSSFIYQMGKKFESFYLNEVVKELEQAKYTNFHSWGIHKGEFSRCKELFEKMCRYSELGQLAGLELLFPFNWNLLQDKIDSKYYSCFMEFDRDVLFWFSYLQETATDEKTLLESCRQYYSSISQFIEPSGEQVKIPKIKILSRLLPDSNEQASAEREREITSITDISKIPPTPKKQIIIQIKPAKPPQSKMLNYSPPEQNPIYASVDLQDENIAFFIESFFERLVKYKFSIPFLQPVDPIVLGIPDYLTIIREPMDFGTIYSKWKSHQYTNLAQLVRDLDLVIFNCNFYNSPDSSVVGNAIKMDEWIKKEVEKLQEQIEKNTVKWEDSEETLIDLKTKFNQLFDNEYSIPFHAPPKFDNNAQQASYKSLVKNPINLGMIKKNLEGENVYRNCEQLFDDIYRVFFNCFVFYSIESKEYQEGKQCQLYFESLFESYLNEKEQSDSVVSSELVDSFIRLIMQHELSLSFNQPVDYTALGIPKYPDMIRNPMDFQTLLNLHCTGENEFLNKMQLIFKNCCKFNIENSDLWKISKVFCNYCIRSWSIFKECDGRIETISELNKKVIQSILDEVVELPCAKSFIYPVNAEVYPTYYNVIKTPMDLKTIQNRITNESVVDVRDIIQNMKLIYKNCVKFNGKESEFSKDALKLESTFESRVNELFFIKKVK